MCDTLAAAALADSQAVRRGHKRSGLVLPCLLARYIFLFPAVRYSLTSSTL